MENNRDRITAIDLAVSQLEAEAVETIDFDNLIEILRETGRDLTSRKRIEKELAELKEDYRIRIMGMLKANLACRENDNERELAVRLTDENTDMNAAELISCYRKTASRFRRNFPATFRNLTFTRTDRNGHKDWRDYKI